MKKRLTMLFDLLNHKQLCNTIPASKCHQGVCSKFRIVTLFSYQHSKITFQESKTSIPNSRQKIPNIKISKDKLMLVLILLIAIASRMIGFGKYPIGIHADEAYAGYEAYCMLHYGIDSWGYRNPVYLTTWGSGMSVLESRLMMPFIKIGGLNLYTIRLPQIIMGIISILVLYLLIKKTCNHQLALWAGFLMAVCPWHIMMSRWGLDANLAPSFILLGTYFSVLSLEKQKYLIVSALFWGLSLYTYALTWFLVPAFLTFSFFYCIKYQKIKMTKYFYFSVVLLGLIALPLILFVAVNKGIIPEITTKYISIPKLVAFRSDELTFTTLPENIKSLLRLYIKQNDYNLMHVIPVFGLYYLFSLPFIIYGGYVCIKNSITDIKNKTFGYNIFLIIWLILCIFLALMRSVNVYRANCMNLAVLILEVIGIYQFCQKLNRNWIKRSLFFMYLLSFCIFEIYYFTVYQKDIAAIQNSGMDQALERALDIQCSQNLNDDYIHISNKYRHSQVLFCLEYPLDLFIDSVQWQNYSEKWIYPKSFGNFIWDTKEFTKGVYVIGADETDKYRDLGYCVEFYDACAVAYK